MGRVFRVGRDQDGTTGWVEVRGPLADQYDPPDGWREASLRERAWHWFTMPRFSLAGYLSVVVFGLVILWMLR